MTRLMTLGLAAAVVMFTKSAGAGPLDAYRGNARPVIVFGSDDIPAFREQIAIFNHASVGLRERDIVLVPANRERQDLRSAYRVSPGEFEVLLVGKDGGVKFRSRKIVPPQQIFRLVDAMPMRRDEMRNRSSHSAG